MSDEFEQYRVNKASPTESDEFEQYRYSNKTAPSNIGGVAGLIMKMMPSIMKPASQGMSERAQGLGRGFTDVGEGLKQVYLRAFGKPGEADKYTKGVQAERDFYEKTPAAHDPLANILREGASSSPYLLAGGPLGTETGMLAKMIMSGATGGAVRASQFVPEGQDRLQESAKTAAISGLLPLAAEAPNAVVKGIDKLKNILTGGTQPLAQEAEKAAEIYGEAQQQSQLAKELAKQEIGKSDPALMQNTLGKHQQKLDEINQELQKETPPDPAQYFVSTPNEAESRLAKSNAIHEKAQENVNQVEKDMGKHLNTGATHDVRAARLIKKDLNTAKDEGTKLYDDVENSVKDQGILLPDSESAKAQVNQLGASLIKDASGIKELKNGPKLLEEIDNVNKSQVIPASDYMSLIKSVKGYARDAYKKAAEPGINEERRQFYRRQADEASTTLEQMNGILENGIGKDNFGKLQEANNYWRKNVIPLYKEPLYWKIMDKEKMSENMASELRGGPAGSGLEIIRNTAKSNPQTLKHIVGQRYDAGKAGADQVMNPDELMREYTDLMPDLQKLTQSKKQADALAEKAAQNVQMNKEAHAESKRMQAEFEKGISKKQDLEKQKAETEYAIELLNKHIPVLREAAANEKLALKDKIIAKNRLKRAEMKRDKLMGKLKIVGYLISAPALGALGIKGVSKASGLFSSEDQL